MKRNDIEFEEIYDLTAVRVLVDTIADCYEVLGKVHSLWKPIPNRIKGILVNQNLMDISPFILLFSVMILNLLRCKLELEKCTMNANTES